MRALIIDPTGRILREVTGRPAFFHLQPGAGESLFAVTDGDVGQIIDDSRLVVSEQGELAPIEPADLAPLPSLRLEYVMKKEEQA